MTADTTARPTHVPTGPAHPETASAGAGRGPRSAVVGAGMRPEMATIGAGLGPEVAAVLGARTAPAAVAEGGALATLVDEMGWALARRRAAHTRRLGRRGITGSQTMLLFHLRMRGDLPMTRLADLLGIGLPNLTGIVDRMEEHGLVARRRVPDDRRLVIVSLTDEGRRIPEEIEGVQRELLVATFATLDDDGLGACLAALREAIARTDEQDIGPGCTLPGAPHRITYRTTDRTTS